MIVNLKLTQIKTVANSEVTSEFSLTQALQTVSFDNPIAVQYNKTSLLLKSFVSLKRHTYIIKQARKRTQLQDIVSNQHYEAHLRAKTFKALLVKK